MKKSYQWQSHIRTQRKWQKGKMEGPHGYNTRSDFGYFSEDLYKTKAGKFFSARRGARQQPLRKPRICAGWGEKIIPLTIAEAQEWAEENLDGDEYSEIFGEPEEAAENKTALNITISAELKSSLDRQRFGNREEYFPNHHGGFRKGGLSNAENYRKKHKA